MVAKDFHTHLLGLIRKSHRQELEYLNSVSEGERTALGTFDHWAPKDRISHSTYWRRRAVETLSYLSRGQTPPEYPPFEECNRQNFDETRDKAVQALLHEADEVLSAIPMALERFSEEAFRKAGYHPYLKNNTLLSYTLHNCYSHPLYHVSEGYLLLGNHSQVNMIQDQILNDIAGIDNSPYAVGSATYDRACFYALNGDQPQALEFLEKSLALRPDLAAWALEDNDLVSLRGDARFQAVIANHADASAG